DLSVESIDGDFALLLSFGQSLLHRTREKVVDAIGNEPAGKRRDQNESHAANQTRAQLVQMFEKGHLPAEVFLARLFFSFRFDYFECHRAGESQFASQPLMFAAGLFRRCGFRKRIRVARLHERGIDRRDRWRDRFGRSRHAPGFQGGSLTRGADSLSRFIENRIAFDRLDSFFVIFQIDLALPGPLEIFGSTAKFRKALSQLAAELRQPAWPKEDERRSQNYEQLRAAQGIEDE